MNGQMQFLHHQVERLFKALNDHNIQVEPDAYPFPDGAGYTMQQGIQQQDIFGAISPSQGRARLVNYQGPAGSDIAFDLPINGSAEGEIPIDKALEYTEPRGAEGAHGPAPTANMSVQIREDPIWSIDAPEAKRLIDIYEEEIGKIYPILDLQEVHQRSDFLFKFLSASKKSGLKSHFDDYPNVARDVNANITKMVLANALATKQGDQGDLGKKLFHSVVEASEKKIWEQLSVDNSAQVLLTLMVTFPCFLVVSPCAKFSRPSIISTLRMSYRHTGSSVWSLVSACKKVFRHTRHMIITSRTMANGLLPRTFSGAFMCLTSSGALQPDTLQISTSQSLIIDYPNL